MNLQQLELLIHSAELGSISKAAGHLHISQPNASSSLKSLEQELGFQLFKRNSSGIQLTELGNEAVQQARVILHHSDRLHSLSTEERPCRFHLALSEYTPMSMAFEQMLVQYQARPQLDFTCQTLNIPDGYAAVYDFSVDLFLLLYVMDKQESLMKDAAKHHLHFQHLAEIPVCINVREGHPAIQNDQLDLKVLEHYPYVDYIKSNLDHSVSRVLSGDTVIRYTYKIGVQQKNTRCRLVGTTDAFSIGCKLPPAVLQQFGIHPFQLDIPGFGAAALMREEDRRNPEIQCYLKLLQQILDTL